METYGPAMASRDRLVEQHLSLVSFLVERMVTQVPSFLSREDLASAGMTGLLDAANRFDPDKGVLFKTFAEQRIRGAIIDEVRRLDWFSRGLRHKQSTLQQAIGRLQQRLGREPDEAEIAAEMGLPLAEYRELLGQVSYLGCVSLNETLDDSDDGHSFLENLADEDRPTVLERLEQSELATEIAGVLEQLSEKERLVISLYYYEELTQKEIAGVLELTEGRVSQLHSQALAKLKTKIARARSREGRR